MLHIVVLAIIGLAVLGGVLALLVGNRGWSWGTVAAGVLVVIAATGYLYLAARILERERVWRELVTRYEAEILAVRDAKEIRGPGSAPTQIAAKKSIADLSDTRSRWARSLSRVETWRGRHWRATGFNPPKDGAAGTVVLTAEEPAGGGEPPAAAPPAGEPAAAEPTAPRPPLNQGAEIAIFDELGVEEGGRFLGLFRVSMVVVDAAARRTTLSVVPIADPDKHDLEAWSRPHDSVVVFENLPVDRWLGYYRTPGPAAEPEKGDKETLEKLLASVERRLKEFDGHGEVVDGEPAELRKRIESGEIPPGRYWAEVQFEADHELDPKVVERIKQVLQPEINHDDPRRARSSFEPGETAAFDLETALGLGDRVKIIRVIDRRPLIDGATTLLGGTVVRGAGDDGLRTDGVTALRRALEADIAALDREIGRLRAATASVGEENEVLSAEEADITDDLRHWKRDEAAAAATVAAFTGRLQAVSRRLAAEVKAIGALGLAVNDAVGRMATAIDAAAPPPGNAAPTAAPVAP